MYKFKFWLRVWLLQNCKAQRLGGRRRFVDTLLSCREEVHTGKPHDQGKVNGLDSFYYLNVVQGVLCPFFFKLFSKSASR